MPSSSACRTGIAPRWCSATSRPDARAGGRRSFDARSARSRAGFREAASGSDRSGPPRAGHSPALTRPDARHGPSFGVPLKLLNQMITAAKGLATNGASTAGSITAGPALLTGGVIRTMAIATPKIASVVLVATTLVIGGAWLSVGLRPFQQAPVGQNSRARIDLRREPGH